MLHEAGETQVLVPAATPGVGRAAMQTADVTRRFGIVTFDDATVPVTAVVGDAGAATPDVDRQIRISLVMLDAESVGTMQAGFDMTVEWAFDRYTFGRPLASYQALKHRFADMFTVARGRATQSPPPPVPPPARARATPAELLSAAKAYIGHYGTELLQDCVQMHGGIGVTYEHDLHLYLRRFAVDRARPGRRPDTASASRRCSMHLTGKRHERAAGRAQDRARRGRGGGSPELPAAGAELHSGQPAQGSCPIT